MTRWTRRDLERALAAARSPLSLNGADLLGVDLSGLDLGGADLAYAHLEDANLTGANLRGAVLFGAKASGACMRRTDLRDANLVAADLTYSDLTQTRLEGSDVTGTDLTGAWIDSPDDLIRRGAIVRTSRAVEIDAEAVGSPIRLRVGEIMRVRLKRPDSPHEWAIADPASELLDAAQPGREPSQVEQPGQPQAVSHDVLASFSFRARQRGRGKLEFRLASPDTDEGFHRVVLEIETVARSFRSID
jgi:hypothetical protein